MCKGAGQRVLVDRACSGELMHKGYGHLSVVGVSPPSPAGHRAALNERDDVLVDAKEALAKGVADRQSLQRKPSAFDWVLGENRREAAGSFPSTDP
jgi:hypothetical protein